MSAASLNGKASFRRSVMRRLLRARTALIVARHRGDLNTYRDAKAEIADAEWWLSFSAGIEDGAA